jgi:hypothetical protein
MALAINIRSDNATAVEIERLWDQVAAFEDEPSMRTLGYRPHLTFAIYDSGIDEAAASNAMLHGGDRPGAIANQIRAYPLVRRLAARALGGAGGGSGARPYARVDQRRHRPGTLPASLPARRLEAALHTRHAHRRSSAR